MKSRFCRQTFRTEPPFTEYLPENTYEVRNNVLRLWLPEEALDKEISVGGQPLYSPDEPDILTDPEISFCPRATPISEFINRGSQVWTGDSFFVWTVDGVVVEMVPPVHEDIHPPLPPNMRTLEPLYFNWLPMIYLIIYAHTARHLKPPRFGDIYGVMLNYIGSDSAVYRNCLIPFQLAILTAAGVIKVIPF